MERVVDNEQSRATVVGSKSLLLKVFLRDSPVHSCRGR